MGYVVDSYGLLLDDPSLFYEPIEVKVQRERVEAQPGGQTDFMSRPEFEVLFGGAAGGGKSYVLCMDALGLQFRETDFGMAAYEHPDYRAIIFRRESTHLSKLIDICNDLYLPLGAKFTLQRKGDPGVCYTFPSGAKIYLAAMEHEKDKEKYQGLEFQYVGFDELTQFLITQYLYLFSRARGVVRSHVDRDSTLPVRIRATTNPTGSGLTWVKKRFIYNGDYVMQPGSTRYFIADPKVKEPSENPTGVEVKPGSKDFMNAKSRTFIPGFLFENKILMDSEPGYAASIMQLGGKMEAALLKGDWDAFGGDFFDMFDRTKMRIKPFHIPEHWELVAAIDPGWSSPCAFGVAARDTDKNMYMLFTYYVKNRDPESHAKNIYKLIKSFPYTQGRMPDIIVSGHDAWAKKERLSIKRTELTFADIFNDNNLYLQKANTSRYVGWWALKQYFKNDMFRYFDGFNSKLLEEITAAQTDEDDIEDIQGCGNDASVPDHALDMIRYLVMALPYPFGGRFDNLPPWAQDKWGKKKKNKQPSTTIMSK